MWCSRCQGLGKGHHAPGLELAGDLGDELGVAAVGEVPEAVLVVERDVGGVLEGASAVGARGERQQHPAVGEQPVQLVEDRDLVRHVLEEVDRADHPDAVVGQVDPLGDVGDDVDALPGY